MNASHTLISSPLFHNCAISGCAGNVYNKTNQLCSKHYQRLTNHGDVNYVHPKTDIAITNENQLTAEMVLDRLEYHKEGGFFTWRKTVAGHAEKLGQRAGNMTPQGYEVIQIGKRKFRVHRLVYLVEKGFIPKMLDHINRNRSDNRIDNIRECTHAENTRNHSKVTNSKTVVGVRILPSGKFHARIKFNGRAITLGTFKTESDASRAYKQKRKELFGEFSPV